MMEIRGSQLIKVVKVNLGLIDLSAHTTSFITLYNDPSLSFYRVQAFPFFFLVITAHLTFFSIDIQIRLH